MQRDPLLTAIAAYRMRFPEEAAIADRFAAFVRRLQVFISSEPSAAPHRYSAQSFGS